MKYPIILRARLSSVVLSANHFIEKKITPYQRLTDDDWESKITTLAAQTLYMNTFITLYSVYCMMMHLIKLINCGSH